MIERSFEAQNPVSPKAFCPLTMSSLSLLKLSFLSIHQQYINVQCITKTSAFEEICVSSSLSDPEQQNIKTSHFLKHLMSDPTFTELPFFHQPQPSNHRSAVITSTTIYKRLNSLQPSYHTHHGPSQQAQCHLAQREWPAAFRSRRAGPCLRIPTYRRLCRGFALRWQRAQLEEQRQGEPFC